MARPTDWDVIGLQGDPTPGVVESVQALAKEFHGFADDAERAWRDLNSFGGDTVALSWIGQSAEAFKESFGPLPGRLQKLYTSYREAGDALDVYWPKLQAAQKKADTALLQGRDAAATVQRASTAANTAATDLKTAQQNHATVPNPQAVTDAQTAHDTAATNLTNAQHALSALTATANQAHDDRIAAAKECQKALHHAQSDGIHNKHWWEHVGEALSEIGGQIAEIANEIAPILDVLALATCWIPGVGEVTAALAEIDNLVALAGTGLKIAGDAMQGHWGDALMGAGMLGLQFVGGKAVEKYGGKALGTLTSKFGKGAASDAEHAVGNEVRTAEGNGTAFCKDDPIDVVSGWMLTHETDLELPGVLPVVLRRAYASGYTTGRLFGPGWSSTLDQRIAVNAAGIHFAGDDAQRLDYPLPTGTEEALPERGTRWPLIWDREADEIRITDPSSGHTRHFTTTHYSDEFGQIRDLTAITDRNDNRIDILRDEHGTPTGIKHSGYRLAIDSTATANGPRVTAIRLLDGSESGVIVKEYNYDDRGRLIGVVNSSGLPLVFDYDQNDRIVSWTDRLGFHYGYRYDDIGRVVSTVGDGGYLSGHFAYDPEGRTTVHTSSLGHSTTFRYDENGHLTTQTDPLGNTVHTVFDHRGRLLARTDQLEHRTVFERDERGNAVRIEQPDGSWTEAAFNSVDKVVAATGADGSVWRREYDDRGNLLSAADPTGVGEEYAYRSDGALAAISRTGRSTTRCETDEAGLPVMVIDPLGAVTRVERDAFGRVLRVVDPTGSATSYEWSVEGLPLRKTDPDGAVTLWTYDAEGQLVSRIDPTGATIHLELGPFGKVVARSALGGQHHRFAFDSELNLVSVTNEAGAEWRYEYDAAGRLAAECDFTGRRLDYEHDPAGRLISRTNGLGEQVRLERDELGRIVRRLAPDTADAFTYDDAGRLRAAVGNRARLDLARDAAGRVTAETVNGRTIRHAYDAAGRRERRTTPAGVTSAWSYDAADRPTALQTAATRVEFAFDAAGREIGRNLGGGAWLERDVDEVGRLTALRLWTADGGIAGTQTASQPETRELVLGRAWAYRADGVPTAINDSRDGIRTFANDGLGRVTAVSAESWSESYAYDALGNLAHADDSRSPELAGTRTSDGNIIRSAGRTSYDHDAVGRLIRVVRRTLDGRRRIWQYAWDSDDRLVRVNTPDGQIWTYDYDPLGRRIGKARFAEDGTLVEKVAFHWEGVLLAEQHAYAPDGTVTTLTWDYEPDTFRPAAQTRRNWAADAAQGDVDETFHAIVTDLAGAPTELVTPDGRIAWRADTSVWGWRVGTSGDSDVDCPLQFPGQYRDAESELCYNVLRYYDPSTASYTSPDPLGLEPAPNDHAYVPNPQIWIDPLGLKCTDPANIGNADLPVHPDINKFYVRAGELVDNRVETHGLNPLQMHGGEEVGHGGVANLSNEDLIRPGGPQGNDPISGFRDWGPRDSGNYPASRIVITGGHHRTAEVVRRVGSGSMDPSTLIEFVIRQ